MAFATAAEVIKDAALEVGLSAPAGGDPWSSQDPHYVQLIALLKSCGRELCRERNWTHLRREHTFTTVVDAEPDGSYAFPSGFLNMIDQTGWVRSTRLPMGGPLSPQEWQYLKARLVGVTLTLLFRPMNQKLYVFPDAPDTPPDLTVAFEYQSGYWARNAAPFTSDPDGDEPLNKDAVIWFDSYLMSRKLKLAFLKAKGFDTTAAQQDYMKAFELTSSDDSNGPILSLSPRSVSILMGERNVPITGFGGTPP